MLVRCGVCGYRWNYRGVGRKYAQCSRCRTYNKIYYENRRWWQ